MMKVWEMKYVVALLHLPTLVIGSLIFRSEDNTIRVSQMDPWVNSTTVVEEKIRVLEGAESTLLLDSELCAKTIVLMALVPVGGHIVTTTDCYGSSRVFIDFVQNEMGIEVTVLDPADVGCLQSALDENIVFMFFAESPSNPLLRCVDIKLVSELCHRKGALVCIDSTLASPHNQKALALGADIVIHSATTYIAGNNDVFGGCISSSKSMVSHIRNMHNMIMADFLNPISADLLIEGMKMMHGRVPIQNATAFKMAQFLEEHPKVRRVYYLGLPSHQDHEISKRQMIGFGNVVTFEIEGDLMITAKFCHVLKIPCITPSFGGCESIVDHPDIMFYWHLGQREGYNCKIKDNLVKFSIGMEHFEDLRAHVLQALESI